jgi:hypothetical protein
MTTTTTTVTTNRPSTATNCGPVPDERDLVAARRRLATDLPPAAHESLVALAGYATMTGYLSAVITTIAKDHHRCRKTHCDTCWALRYAQATLAAFDEWRPA